MVRRTVFRAVLSGRDVVDFIYYITQPPVEHRYSDTCWARLATMEERNVKIFFDLYSQPCRAVLLFLQVNKVPYEPVSLDLCNGKMCGSS